MLNPTFEQRLDVPATIVTRLRCLEAQLEQITQLLEAEVGGPAVLIRIFAAQDALHTIGRRLANEHLRASLRRLAQMPDEASAQHILAEVLELYGARCKHATFAPTTR